MKPAILQTYRKDGNAHITPVWFREHDGAFEVVTVEAVDPYARELDDLARAVRGGGGPRLGRADAVGQARTIEALYAAARAPRV